MVLLRAVSSQVAGSIVLATGSSLYSREWTTQASKPWRCITAGMILSSLRVRRRSRSVAAILISIEEKVVVRRSNSDVPIVRAAAFPHGSLELSP
jgi:hypothetical protein